MIWRHLRFVGVTRRQKTSPNAWRWQQHAEWTSRLPTGLVVNVSLPWVWSYFADQQPKLTRSFRPVDWLAEDEGPGRDEKTRKALDGAVALVRYGRSREGRRAIARATGGEPALRESWLRSLVAGLVR